MNISQLDDGAQIPAIPIGNKDKRHLRKRGALQTVISLYRYQLTKFLPNLLIAAATIYNISTAAIERKVQTSVKDT
jgi:hypothetical protein